jgi:hypothetical protein
LATQSRNTISSQLNTARLAINNTLANPQIKMLVAVRGYNAEVMAEGQSLYQGAVQAVDAQAAAAGTQRLATSQVHQAERQARACYQGLVQTVRAVFPAGSPQRKALDVKGATPGDTVAFVGVATTLFNNALGIKEIGVVLAKYGYDVATLHKERNVLMAYQQSLETQTQAKSAALEATQAQAKALAELQRWVAQYLKIARIALRGHPNLLQALGITPPSIKERPAQEQKV